ncbi:MAG TPA: sulfate adenylyltransferase, partial [Microterricola sp.]
AVNKIDLLDYDEAAFDRVAAGVRAVTDELGIDAVHVIPVSALAGDNVVERSINTPWYDGPSLLELLETLPLIDEAESALEAFRLPVQLVIRPQGAVAVAPEDADSYRDYRAYAGQVASGSVSVGDSVTVVPGGGTTIVTGIDFAGIALETAIAPQSVALRLRDDLDVARGAVITASDRVPEVRKDLSVALFWLDPRPLRPGARVLVKFGTSTVQAILTTVSGRRNLDTLAIEEASGLDINDIGHADIRLASALPVEEYAVNRRAGAFLVIHPQDGATLAAGIVIPHTTESAA